MDDALYWMWLAGAVGSGFRQAGRLLADWPDAAALYAAVRAGDLPEYLTDHARERLAATDPWTYEPLLDHCLLAGVTVLTPDDDAFPARLRALPDAPLLLYATGDAACLNGRRYVGMVGTRRPTAYGEQACDDISFALAQQGVVLVSGLAEGLDSMAQRAAVEAHMPTVAFLGTGITAHYAAARTALRDKIESLGGCVVSEYPPNFQGRAKGTFLARNRLIAGQAEVLCVTEARTRSGTLNTVEHAERYGRPVMAVPGSIYSPTSQGTNELLRSGRAAMLCGAGDVLAMLGIESAGAAPQPDEAPLPALSGDAAAVLAQLSQIPQNTDALRVLTGLTAARMTAALMELEMAGLARDVNGRRYVRL